MSLKSLGNSGFSLEKFREFEICSCRTASYCLFGPREYKWVLKCAMTLGRRAVFRSPLSLISKLARRLVRNTRSAPRNESWICVLSRCFEREPSLRGHPLKVVRIFGILRFSKLNNSRKNFLIKRGIIPRGFQAHKMSFILSVSQGPPFFSLMYSVDYINNYSLLFRRKSTPQIHEMNKF